MSSLQIKEEKVKADTNGESLVTGFLVTAASNETVILKACGTCQLWNGAQIRNWGYISEEGIFSRFF